jgi:Ca2+-binding EF-hand superfamily protein
MKLQLGLCVGVASLFFVSPLFAVEGKSAKESIQERIKQFDTNGDGKLSADEKAAAKAAMGDPKAGKRDSVNESKTGLQKKVLDEFDANANGKLDPDEQTAARKAATERRKNKKKGPQNGANPNAPNAGNQGNGINGMNGQALGGNAGNGGAGRGNQGSGRAKLMEKFDMNRDGILSAEEMARAKQFMGGGANLPPNLGQQGGRPNVVPQRPFKQ